MEIDLLGRFDVRRDGESVAPAEFGGRRVRQLVRILASDRGRAFTRDALIEALWGDQPPEDPRTNLNVVVNRARRALRETDLIQTSGQGYLLRAGDAVVVDLECFAEEVNRARSAFDEGDTARAAAAARAALVTWGEPLTEDAHAEWARGPRDRLERLHQEVLEIAAETCLASGRSREAVDLASEAVACQPLREAARLLLVRALVADGDQGAAVQAFQDLRRMLADELGLDPSPEATALYDRLLHGTLSAPVRGRRVGPPATPLVGRRRELEELLMLGGAAKVAVLSGRSGWGKSRLLDDVQTHSDRAVLAARGLLPEREEPWSLVRALLQTATAGVSDLVSSLGATTIAALRDVLPDIDVPADSPVDSRSRRALVQQGLVRMIEATAPSLVVVDDLQWADSSSLDVLALISARDADVTMVVAFRPEEVDEGSPATSFLSSIREMHPVELELGPLAGDALGQLVGSASVGAELSAHTDGSPFAVLQVIRALEREGYLERADGGTWSVSAKPPPGRVAEIARAGQRDAVWRQFEHQPQLTREVLAALALFARPVPARLLAAVAGIPLDDVMRVLRGLARDHLVRHDAEGFRAAHDLVGETVRDRLDAVERARLHQRIADVLGDGPKDELARHLRGAGDTAAAASAFAAAAQARLARFADGEAQQLAVEGLALDPDPEVSGALLEVRAETFARHEDLELAREDLRAALALTRSRTARSRLLTRLAELTSGAEDLLRAAELADQALAEAGSDEHARARALYVRALVDMNFGQRELCEQRFEESLEIFTRLGDAGGRADILDARAMSTFGFGDIKAGIVEFDRVARLFHDSGNLLRIVTPRSTRGHGLLFSGRPHEGLAETTRALELARTLGYAEGEAMVLWHHAEVLIGCGRPEEALTAADTGAGIARRLGHRGWRTMTVCARGLARAALGDLDGAVASFEESLGTSENLLWFASWTHSRLARVLLELGRIEEAVPHVRSAQEIGPPGLQLYEARLAECELAVAAGDERAPRLIDEAVRLAEEGGHAVSATRLRELRDGSGGA